MTMRVDNMIQSLRILVKADAMIAERAFKTRLSQIALHGMALIVAVFGLVMIGLAIFFTLQDLWGTILASAAVGFGSLVLSAVIVTFSSLRRPARDLQFAQDMHKMALESLIDEARLAGQDLSSIRGLVRSAAQGTLIGSIAPIMSLLLRLLNRSVAAKPSPEK
jgi:hypothetical protein